MFVFIRQDSAAGFFRFCSSFSFLPAAAVLFRPVFCRLVLSAQKTSGSTLLAGAITKKGISGNFQCFTQETPPFTQKRLAFYPPRAIFGLASDLCFLVSPIHVVVRVGRDGGAPPCPVPIYDFMCIAGGILNGLLSQTRHARPGACSGTFRQEKGISPSPRCRTTDRSSRSRLCHDDRHGPSCFCRYL